MSSSSSPFGLGPCPPQLIRTVSSNNQSTNQNETDYINQRSGVTQSSWTEWLGDISAIGYSGDSTSSLTSLPVLGLAMGGQGLRGTLFSAGVVNAFDSQNTTSKSKGTGGILGSALFQSGSSGASFIFPGFGGTTTRGGQFIAIPPDREGPLLNMSLVTPAGPKLEGTNNEVFYGILLAGVSAKAQNNFNTSLVDVWGQMLAYRFTNGTTRDNFYTNQTSHGSDVLFSNSPQLAIYQNASQPFPILTLNSQISDSTQSALSVAYEITPYEMGSFDLRIAAMTQMKYAGTQLINGSPADSASCVTGFDQAGFLMGTSSSPFYNSQNASEPNIDGFDEAATNGFNFLLSELKNRVNTSRFDVGNWPNPFQGLMSSSFPDSGSESLKLGGAADYLPVEQLLVRSRNVSLIFVMDSTGDNTGNNWPDGKAMNVVKQRVDTVLSQDQSHKPFPPIPTDFIATGVNLRPTFFGCANASDTSAPDSPLIVYIPNAPPADGSDPVTNPSGFKTAYTDLHVQKFFDQAFMSATSGFVKGKLGSDPNFPSCLKCAAVDGNRFPSSGSDSSSSVIPRSSFCESCFTQYCYDPSNPPSKADVPGRKLVFVDPDNQPSFVHRHRTQIAVGVSIGVAAFIAIIVALIIWRRRRRANARRGIRPVPVTDPHSGPSYEAISRNSDD